jgi:hypothetical protein
MGQINTCYYLILRKTVKWWKKVVLYLMNCELFNAVFSYKKNPSECTSGELEQAENEPTLRRPTQDAPGRLSGDFQNHKLEKIVGAGQGKKKYPARLQSLCEKQKTQ